MFDLALLTKNLAKLSAQPTALLALVGLVLLLLALLRMRRVELTPRLMANVGMMLALATVLKMLRLYHLPQGGSITLGSMVPIMLLAVFYGPEVGFLAGFLYGMITLLLDPYVLHPLQVLFDYPLPFIVLGVVGWFRQKVLLGTALAVITRFLCHYISGVVFFASYAPPGMSPYWYSLLVNGSFMGLEGVICLAVMAALPLKRLQGVFARNGYMRGQLLKKV